MKKCIKCGMPMEEPEDFSQKDPQADECVHCGPDETSKTEKELDDPTKGNLG